MAWQIKNKSVKKINKNQSWRKERKVIKCYCEISKRVEKIILDNSNLLVIDKIYIWDLHV